MLGGDIVNLFEELGWPKRGLVWKLLRSHHRNTQLKVSGILITGTLTNKIVGMALENETNVIICSDQNIPFSKFDRFNGLFEILYKHEIYVLEWNYQDLIGSNVGQMLLGRIFGADNQLNQVPDNMVRYQFDHKVPFQVVVDRIKHGLLFTKNETIDLTHKIDTFLFVESWNEEVSQFILDQSFIDVIVTTQLPPRTHWYIQRGAVLVMIQLPSLLNEMARELYYVVKTGQSIPVMLEFTRNYHTITW